LNRAVEFSHEIWPACLYQIETALRVPLKIAGFGQTSVKDSEYLNLSDKHLSNYYRIPRTATLQSSVMMNAEVEEIPLAECRENYSIAYKGGNVRGLSSGITETLLCAKNRRKHADTCKGMNLFEELFVYLNFN
jgi:hypothetical protein